MESIYFGPQRPQLFFFDALSSIFLLLTGILEAASKSIFLMAWISSVGAEENRFLQHVLEFMFYSENHTCQSRDFFLTFESRKKSISSNLWKINDWNWNLKITQLKRENYLNQTSILGVHIPQTRRFQRKSRSLINTWWFWQTYWPTVQLPWAVTVCCLEHLPWWRKIWWSDWYRSICDMTPLGKFYGNEPVPLCWKSLSHAELSWPPCHVY